MMHAVSMRFLIEMCAFLRKSLQVSSHLSSHEVNVLHFYSSAADFCFAV